MHARSVALTGILLAALPVTAPLAADTGAVLEEVTVTAQKRAESLQRVPISIVALSGAALEDAGVHDTFDLQMLAPGLLASNLFQAEIYVRGIGSDLQGVGTDPSVAVHVDGVYIPRPNAALQSFHDVDRIEVLRGPQGTLYGRNATGGAVNIISHRPTDTFESAIEVDLGNYDAVRVRGGLSGPLGSDNLKGRLSFLQSRRDGFSTNFLDGSELSDEDVRAARVLLDYAVNDDLSLLVSADVTRDRSKNSTPKLMDPQNSPSVSFGGRVSPDPFDVYLDIYGSEQRDQDGASLTVSWDTAGFGLQSISSYRESDTLRRIDSDGTDFPFIGDDGDTEKSRTFTQEVQFTSAGDGRFDWLAGLYYLEEDAKAQFRIPFPVASLLLLIPGENDTRAKAAFGQASLALTDRLRVVGGLRYSDESKQFTEQTLVNGAPVFSKGGDNSWSAWTPKFGIEYAPRDDVFLYLSATRGFKSGGYNTGGAGLEYDPEFVWSYETGIKSTLFDGRLVANASAFYYDYTDLQVQVLEGTSTVVTNAGKAKGRGLELELMARPSERWNLRVGIAALDAEFTALMTRDPNVPSLPVLDLSGNRLPRAPKLSATAMLQYSIPVRAWGALHLQGDYRYQGHTYFSQFNVSPEEQEAYSVYNGRIAFESASGHWSLALWGRNLGNEDYLNNALRIDIVGGTTIGFLAPPRTYGIGIAYRL